MCSLNPSLPLLNCLFSHQRTADYRIFIRRRELGRRAHLYAFGLRKPIPTFPLPLLAGDQEPLVDLGSILHDLYARARYWLIIDYNKPPIPTLTEEDAAWATTCLTMSQRQESQTHES